MGPLHDSATARSRRSAGPAYSDPFARRGRRRHQRSTTTDSTSPALPTSRDPSSRHFRPTILASNSLGYRRAAARVPTRRHAAKLSQGQLPTPATLSTRRSPPGCFGRCISIPRRFADWPWPSSRCTCQARRYLARALIWRVSRMSNRSCRVGVATPRCIGVYPQKRDRDTS